MPSPWSSCEKCSVLPQKWAQLLCAELWPLTSCDTLMLCLKEKSNPDSYCILYTFFSWFLPFLKTCCECQHTHMCSYKLATRHRTLLTLAVDQHKVSVDAQRGHVLLWRTSQDSVQTFTFIQSQHLWAADLCYRLFLPSEDGPEGVREELLRMSVVLCLQHCLFSMRDGEH